MQVQVRHLKKFSRHFLLENTSRVSLGVQQSDTSLLESIPQGEGVTGTPDAQEHGTDQRI